MSTIMFPQKDLREETAALRAQILDRLSKLPWDGLSFVHPVPGLSLYRIVEPAGPFSSVYEPSLSFIIKGSKNVRVGNETLVYDEGCFFLTAIGVPVTAQICAASEGEPYVAAALRLDMEKVRRIIADHDIHPTDIPERDLGVAVGTATRELFDALFRLISLASSPADIPFLAGHIQNEILYRLLTGEQGARLRRFALAGTNSNRVAKAVLWLKENYTKPLRVEELAEIANMGVSTLHHHFRAMTAMSPLQFQKHLRLHHARELMLSKSLDAATAALQVGYESPTQFNREYRRAFGHPPLRDIRAILNSNDSTRRNSAG
ncbi:AraC family transcriptional regulator N-terminal domain-containing protein [Sinorhizobium meliloti]|uniref:AraC family transcriptional regulator n=1 Tax=Rhizobium meliloti TaxID=382 RepID=UPI0004000BE7|nr:AraC family transcriptional regulator [Sinorhizobium meliloti]MQW55578.1 helix-turn-helix domain-containing protein [Sinorhizobium meliloti]MQX43148.1 helix-turn-helix domain-containing protein [Sinorhizobium meliloti]MQX91841.1 helix-turn-helix domain-containing protein [Sinorhizobium meliloti]RVO71402.1 AraC family transcriptional regulator [Sinorhizobium meliloti]RVQ59254.1 AraC family transcriptional regulator [Sinorhizobium meliloti]